MSWRRFGANLVVLGMITPARGANPGPSAPPPPLPTVARPALTVAPAGNDPAYAILARTLRSLLVPMLPPTLYEASPGWGKTTQVVTGLTGKGKGRHAHLEPKYGQRNHGVWRKIRVTANPNSLVVDLRGVKPVDADRTTFGLFLAFDARVEYVRQRWSGGVKLLDQSVRARLRVLVPLQCELTSRLEANNFLIPDLVFRIRVLAANVHYDQLVCEHFAGFGGTTAKVVGELIMKGIRQWHPSIERNLLAKANAAIIKAGDTKEVRVGLGKLLSK